MALVPDVIALTESLSENAGPLLDALFGTDAVDLQTVTDAYRSVNRNAEDVFKNAEEQVNAVNFVNFVTLVHKLAAGTTPDNSRPSRWFTELSNWYMRNCWPNIARDRRITR